MGYSTDFSGEFKLTPTLTISQYNALKTLADERHDGQSTPSYYCQWIPNREGTSLKWDGNEKFYSYVEWLEYIIDKHLKPWGIEANGTVEFQGEEIGDVGEIVVTANKVTVKDRETRSDRQQERVAALRFASYDFIDVINLMEFQNTTEGTPREVLVYYRAKEK